MINWFNFMRLMDISSDTLCVRSWLGSAGPAGRRSGAGVCCRLSRAVLTLLLVVAALPVCAGGGKEDYRERWTSCLKEYVQHTSYEKFYLNEIDKINRSNADSVKPGQLAASYYPMCKMFTERGEFLAEILFARQVFNDLGKTAAASSDYFIMAKYANSAGIGYTALRFYDEALKMFDKGTAIARKYGFRDVLSQIYTNQAQLYYDTGEYGKALNLLEIKIKKLGYVDASLYNNIALVYSSLGKHTEAMAYLDSALHMSEGDAELSARIYTNKGSLLTETARYAEAEQCLVMADKLLGDSSPTVLRLMVQLNFVQLYLARGDRLKAVSGMELIEESLKSGLSEAMKGKYLKDIAGLYIQLGDYARASACLQESIKLNDSINYDNQKRQLFQLMTWYDIAQLRNDNMQLKMKYEFANIQLRNRTIIAVATILVAVLLSVLVVVSIKKRKNEQRQSAIILEQEKKLHLFEQKEHEREKTRMETEIGRKNRELATFSIDLSSIDALHENICEELAGLAGDVHDDEIRHRINTISLTLRRQTSSRLSEGFKKYFNEVSPLFDAKLKEKHPNLTANDCRLCAYIYMGLTSKEISQLTFREVESVEKSRNRLRKKISLPSDMPIRGYLMQVVDGDPAAADGQPAVSDADAAS